MFVFIYDNKAKRIQQILKFIHYSSITTNSLIRLKVRNAGKKIIYWKFLFRGLEKKQKRAGETEDVQQALLHANRKRNAGARQLKTVDI